MRLDLTFRRPFQEEVVKQYGVRGVPTVIFLNRAGIEEKRMRIESLVQDEKVTAFLLNADLVLQ